MKLNAQVIVPTLLILAVPFTVGFALHEQNIKENAAISLTQCDIKDPSACPSGYGCKPVTAHASAGFCILKASLSPQPTKISELSCKTCAASGMQSLCINIRTATAYCAGIPLAQDTASQAGIFCLKCLSPPSIPPSIPPGCRVIPCTLMCPQTNPQCCPVRYVCPTGTIPPSPPE